MYEDGRLELEWASLLGKMHQNPPPLFLDDTSPCEMLLEEQAKKLNERIIASKNEKSDEKLG